MNLRTPISRTMPVLVMAVSALVAMSSAHAEGRFVVSADGQEVTDTQTKLIWQRCTVGQKWDGKTCAGKATKMSLRDAKAMGANATPAWHLPTKDELMSIVDKTAKKPAIDKLAFPDTPANVFWAANPGSTDNLTAWIVNFKNGKVFANTHNSKFYLRLVRSS